VRCSVCSRLRDEPECASALFGAAKPAAPSAMGTGAPASMTTAPAATSAAVSLSPPSVLRGKSIEEIVNRWSSDLETHVRQFNKSATEIAVWDRELIQNGNNV
jgi:nuclear pore complex protein Nup62